ncbi:MAG: zinc/iron-chelating domain-containing protein [Thalassobium sp.]|nr:MAG: zinc/iron-chelating domain-containing protein [Thalassobium sp.]PHQ88296.1 MAG: zinc/iron-chelating domain-containing protein [Thalassobium sp.]
MSFPCTRCGLCCKNISSVQSLKNFDDGSGRCIHLHDVIGCTIYNERPIACRIDEGYTQYAPSEMSREEYVIKNIEICNFLQEEAGLDEKYRIEL